MSYASFNVYMCRGNALCGRKTKSSIVVSVFSLMYLTRSILSVSIAVWLVVFVLSFCVSHCVGV